MKIDCTDVVEYEVCGVDVIPSGFSDVYYFDTAKVTTYTASANKDVITGLDMPIGDKAKRIAVLPNSIEITDPVQGTVETGQFLVETVKFLLANPNSIDAKKLRAKLQMCDCVRYGFIFTNNGGTDYLWSPDPAAFATVGALSSSLITFEPQETSTYGKKASEPAQSGIVLKRETTNSNFVMLPISAARTGYIE
jgi:hypothetical protein